jgi:serine/threonine-protein kinase
MDYVDGYTFGSLLKRKSRLPQIDALIICESVADAMKYAWDQFGIIHCDIKPDNIMVDRDGTVKVLDLGLCQSTAVLKNAARSEEVVGTPAYISPEQIYGDEELDCRADIYSLGATLYHLTTGRMLFPILSNDDILRAHVDPDSQAPDPRTMAPLLTEHFVRLLAGMLVKDRDLRYQTWHDVFNAARIVEEGGDLPPIPEGTVSSIRFDKS